MNPFSRGLWLGPVFACLGLACGSPGNGSDAGVDAGIGCTFGSCGESGVCDTSTKRCVLKQCSETAQQPDVCSNGAYCASYDQTKYNCYDVGGACTSPAVTWNPATSSGPVIYYVQPTTKDTTWCSGSTPADVTLLVSLYNKNGTFAAAGDTFPSNTLFFVRADGSQVDAKTLFRPATGYDVSADRKHLDLKLNFCGVTGASLVAGFFYTDGNEYCGSFSK